MAFENKCFAESKSESQQVLLLFFSSWGLNVYWYAK